MGIGWQHFTLAMVLARLCVMSIKDRSTNATQEIPGGKRLLADTTVWRINKNKISHENLSILANSESGILVNKH